MFANLKIARIHGINLYIHWTFWLLPLWVVFTWHGSEVLPLWMYLLLIGTLFACVVLHEFGHALMAERFGIRTRRITLSPLGGIAQLERMSQKPWEEFCIAVAGPLVNVVIAALLGAVFVAGAAVAPSLMETQAWYFLGLLVALNVVMVVFNMIPAFPMDGGRVLRAILANTMGLLPGTRVAVTVGTVCAILMGLAGAFGLDNPWLLLIALFVILAGRQELAALEMDERHRLAAEDEVTPNAHVTLCLWDPVRGTWVRRKYGDDV
jgi:Zn-dependent protease